MTLFTASGARHARTDAEGAFEVDDLAPGRVRIAVTARGARARRGRWSQVDGDRDHPADLGAIDLAEAGEVEGEVVDADDQPVAGARVAPRRGARRTCRSARCRAGSCATDRDGRFTLGGLPEGKVTLEAYFADLGRGVDRRRAGARRAHDDAREDHARRAARRPRASRRAPAASR